MLYYRTAVGPALHRARSGAANAAAQGDWWGIMTKVWIGTSGWVYKHWLGIFYPPE